MKQEYHILATLCVILLCVSVISAVPQVNVPVVSGNGEMIIQATLAGKNSEDSSTRDSAHTRSSNVSEKFTVIQKLINDNLIDQYSIGPGLPPDEWKKNTNFADLTSTSTNTIADIPALIYSYGSSPTAATMIFGYYDRNGYPNMYTGPTGGGVFPLTNAVWGTSSEGFGQCPLTASQSGLDGRTTNGHKDDYYVAKGSTATDPYITGYWTQHTPPDCVADYMKTSIGGYNGDGDTTFYTFSNAQPFYFPNDYGVSNRDGVGGMRSFAESRGYTVNVSYNQLLKGTGYWEGWIGFTYDQYKAEIDAGYPVLINLMGGSILGIGYTGTDQVIMYDTWDYSPHTMAWGGSYAGRQMYSVSIIHLDPPSTQNMTVTSILPSSGQQGRTYTITVTGKNFEPGKSTVSVSGTGVTVGTYPTRTDTQIVVPLSIATGATTGARTITVTNPTSGSTARGTFVIGRNTGISPSITTISPNSGQKGGSYTVTISGKNFEAKKSTVTVSGTGVTVGTYKTRTETKIVVPITITTGASIGKRTVTVKNPVGGGTATKTFTVAAGPTISKISPSNGAPGKTYTSTITGTGFEAKKSKVSISGSGVKIGKYTVPNDKKIVIQFIVAKTAKIGPRVVTVKNPTYGGVVTGTFTVGTLPTIKSISPKSVSKSTKFPMTITGTNFEPKKSRVSISGSGVKVLKYTTQTDKKIVVQLSVTKTATTGTHTVAVLNPTSGLSAKKTFTVKAKGTSTSQAEPVSLQSNGVLSSPVLFSSSGISYENNALTGGTVMPVFTPGVV